MENLSSPKTSNPSLPKDNQNKSNLKSTSSKNVQCSKKNLQKTIYLSSTNTTENKLHRFFTVGFDPTLTLKVNPYDLTNSIEELTGKPPISIVKNGKTAFTVKCASKTQSIKLLSLNKVGSIPCKTSLHLRFNTSKGLIFLTEFDIDDQPKFGKELNDHYNISEIERADFIKTRSEKTKAFVVTFDREKLLYLRRNTVLREKLLYSVYTG